MIGFAFGFWFVAQKAGADILDVCVEVLGNEGSTAGGVAACLTTLGFLATPACWLAACLPGQRLLGEGVEVSASTVGREGGEGTTTGSGAAATTPVTTAAFVCLPGSSWMNWPPRATSRLLLMSTRSLKLLRKSAPSMGKATGARRKVQKNCLVLVRTVHVRQPQQWSGLPSAVISLGPVGSAEDLWGRILKALRESTRYLLELVTSTR